MTEPSDLDERLERLQDKVLHPVQALMDAVVVQASPAGSSLVPMTRYHLETGGKRLRAVLPSLWAESLGADPLKAVPFGAACEMLHNATLVHDDLQDGDTHRRGRPTIWKRFGSPQAVNLGDAMFHYTFLLVDELDMPAESRTLLIRTVVQDTLRIIDGQEREFALKLSERPSMDDYLRMVRGKTSALMALAMGGGAVIADAPPPMVEAIRDVADNLGILFQVQDDVLDLYGSKGRGRPGEDVAEGKRSCLVVHALEHLPESERERLAHILDLPKEQTEDAHIQEVEQLFQRAASLDHCLEEIRRREKAAHTAAASTGHREVIRLTDYLSQLFLRPIQAVMQASRRQAPPPRPGPDGADEEEDTSFELRMLPEVSRTFALSIEALPPGLRSAVRTAYLVCRIVDTIEDDPRLASDRRQSLFRQFEALVRGEGDPAAFSQAPEWNLDTPDAELCRGAAHVFGSLHRLPPQIRAEIQPSVLEMASGMDEYTRRQAVEGALRIRDLADLDRYCYFVAGTVGRLLTGLFLQFAPVPDPSVQARLRASSVAFGQGLQLVNVLKDLEADLERGVCFLPEDILTRHGLDRSCLGASDRSPRGPWMDPVLHRAREHLEKAIEYTLSWPDAVPDAAEVRFFCAVPLTLALGTLSALESKGGPAPKLTRGEVLSVFGQARDAASDDARLRQLFEQWGAPRSPAPVGA